MTCALGDLHWNAHLPSGYSEEEKGGEQHHYCWFHFSLRRERPHTLFVRRRLGCPWERVKGYHKAPWKLGPPRPSVTIHNGPAILSAL